MLRILKTFCTVSLFTLTTACAPTAPTSSQPPYAQAEAMEMLSYHTKWHVSKNAHSKHIERYIKQLQTQSGYIGQSLSHNDDGLWIHITYWENEEDAVNARDYLQKNDPEILQDVFGDMKDTGGKLAATEIILR